MPVDLPEIVIDREGKTQVGFLHGQLRSHIPAGSLKWLVGLSLCSLALTSFFAWQAHRFCAQAVALEGRISRVTERPLVDANGKRSVTFCATYSFTDQAGLLREHTDSVCFGSAPAIGAPVTILYDKAQPETVVVDSITGRYLSVMIAAAVTTLLGLLSVYAWKTGAHDYRAEIINTEVWVDRGDEARKPFAGATITSSVGVDKTECEPPDPSRRT